MKIDEKYLPLGTVVLLNNAVHRAMIVGYCAKLAEEPDAPYYDYIGALFPEGIFTSEQTMVFNHNDIKEVFHLGLVDVEVKQFHERLNNLMKDIEGDK